MEESKDNKPEETKAAEEPKAEKPSRKEEKLQKRLEEAEAAADKWKNEYYRAYADVENLRKSLEEDHRNALKYRAEGFLEGLVPALDAFYGALQAPVSSKEAENYKVGFTYIYRQIVSALEAEGFKEIEPKAGDPFDPLYMHAVDTVESDKPGLVDKVHAKGYQLRDRMIRPVMVTVTVARKEETKAEEPKEDSSKQAHEA